MAARRSYGTGSLYVRADAPAASVGTASGAQRPPGQAQASARSAPRAQRRVTRAQAEAELRELMPPVDATPTRRERADD